MHDILPYVEIEPAALSSAAKGTFYWVTKSVSEIQSRNTFITQKNEQIVLQFFLNLLLLFNFE